MLKTLIMNLAIFDGAAAAPGGEGTAGGNGNGEAFGKPASADSKSASFDNVVFGKKPDNPPAGTEPTKDNDVKNNPQDKKALFEELIKGEYRKEYSERFQEEFNKRHRNHKELVENFNKADRIVRILAEKYGERDITKLEEKILGDNAHLEKEALERGIDVEQLAEIKRLRGEAEAERSRRERVERERNADEQYNSWINQARELKNNFPDFQLNEEIKNPVFMDLLQRGISVDHAYKILHYEELVNKSVSDAAKQSSKATADAIAARGSRPKENGNNSSAIIYKTDVSKLTKEERAEIAKRVARGETISF